MRNDFESNYLAHHGILGMKWGKKNGPPYPLSPGDHSAREKKAGWRQSLKDDRAKRAREESQRAHKKYEKKVERLRKDYEPYLNAMDKKAERRQQQADDYRNGRKGLTEGQKKAIKVGAAVAVTALAAYGGYKLSKYIKTEAGRRIVAEGNKKAAELIKKAGEYRNMAGSAGNLPGQMHRHMLFTQKAVNTENQAAKLLKDTVDRANSTSNSLKKSYDYLKNDAAKATRTVPQLKFGESTQKFTKADQDRLSEIANNLLREAQRRNGIVNENTVSFDYAKDLVKKNKINLSQYTMQDLKDLDLY